MNQKLWDQVVEIQKDFVYELQVKSGGYEAWMCHKPNTIIYSFEIVLGRRGIYVGGDINSLVFRVARGMDFLAGRDIDYYIHSKLESKFRDCMELDEGAKLLWYKERVQEFFQDECDWLEKCNSIESVFEKIKTKLPVDSDMLELYYSLRDADSLEAMYVLKECCTEEDVRGLGKPSLSVMFPLYMVCCAARRIVQLGNEIKAEPADAKT